MLLVWCVFAYLGVAMVLPVPEAALGAIFTAIFTGFIGLIGLVISKENKTSDFRQTWIDELRKDFVGFLADSNRLVDERDLLKLSGSRDFATGANLVDNFNRSTYKIYLRLNKNEKLAQDLFVTMKLISDHNRDFDGWRFAEARRLEDQFISESQEILKTEWKRVKNGEIFYRVAKYSLAFFIPAAIFFMAIAISSKKFDEPRNLPLSKSCDSNTCTPRGQKSNLK
jgi:hypothetical protein